MLPFQIALIFLLVSRNRSCAAGWTNAGEWRRLATLNWASGYLLRNGDLGQKHKIGITSTDMFPSGLDNADMKQHHAQLANWLNYWSVLHPTDTLAQAMLNLIVRMLKAKDGWRAERGDEPFPFDEPIAGVTSAKFEDWWKVFMHGEKI
jgi:hypothetical protein